MSGRKPDSVTEKSPQAPVPPNVLFPWRAYHCHLPSPSEGQRGDPVQARGFPSEAKGTFGSRKGFQRKFFFVL